MGELAKSIGVDPASLSRAVAGKKEFPALRRKVDLFFGEPILTLPHEFYYWNSVSDSIGVDPVAAPMSILRKRAKQLGVGATQKPTREHLVQKMLGAAASRGQSGKSKMTLGALANALGPLPGVPTSYSPRRGAAKAQSETSQTRKPYNNKKQNT